jgi:hypothetical protein
MGPACGARKIAWTPGSNAMKKEPESRPPAPGQEVATGKDSHGTHPVGGAIGVAGGAIAGAAVGAIGGPAGMIAGAAAGAVLGVLGGAAGVL